MHTIDPRHLPTADEIAEILEPTHPATADSLRDGLEVTVRSLLAVEDPAVLGVGEYRSVSAVAVVVEWDVAPSWHRYSGGRRALTLVQVITGGTYAGEGSATCAQVMCLGALSEADAAAVARMTARGALPVVVAEEEL